MVELIKDLIFTTDIANLKKDSKYMSCLVNPNPNFVMTYFPFATVIFTF